jgi:hypothetical protein
MSCRSKDVTSYLRLFSGQISPKRVLLALTLTLSRKINSNFSDLFTIKIVMYFL